jgi:hypothetical protein
MMPMAAEITLAVPWRPRAAVPLSLRERDGRGCAPTADNRSLSPDLSSLNLSIPESLNPQIPLISSLIFTVLIIS